MKNTPPLTLLIVEDNEGDQFLLTQLLKTSPLPISQIIYAGTLKAAATLVSIKLIDLILLDLSLPDSKGLDTFLSLKLSGLQIPVVILSGLADTALALEAISEGAQDYLVKDDFDSRLLVKTILYSIERRKNLEQLHLSNERYKLVSKATNDLVWDWDLKTGKIFRNEEQFKKILKLSFEQEQQAEAFWFSRVHPEDLHQLKEGTEAFLRDTNKNNFESAYRFLRGDNTYAYLNDRGYVIRDEHGLPVRIIGATQDITEKKNAENELRKLSIIASETVNAVIITDINGNIEWVNEAFTKITEYELAEVTGKKPGAFLQGEETNKEKISHMRQRINEKLPFDCEVINYSKSGRKYWIKIQVQPIFNEKNILTHFFAIETDITERKLSEQALKKSEKEFRNLFNNSPANIFIWYLEDFSIAAVNQTATQQYGYSREELLKMTVLDLRRPEDYPHIKAFAQKALQKKAAKDTNVWKHINKNGELMHMQITAEKIDYNGKAAILSISINITEKLELEKKLELEERKKEQDITRAVITAQERERAEIGRELHDNVNQILATVRLYLGLIKKDQKTHFYLLKNTDELVNTAIEELRGLSHSLIPPSLKEDDFMDALEKIIEMTSIDNSLVIEKSIINVEGSKLPDKIQLTIYRIIQEQFNNILKHAKADKIFLSLSQNDHAITLSIKDNGVGFDTADKVKGVGLLNIQTRASLLGGKMTIVSAPGEGCELKVEFINGL